MPSTASKKGKQKTAVEYELNSSKIAVKVRKKNQDDLHWNCTTRRIHTEELAQDPNPSHLQERWQRRCMQLQADMQPASTIQTICHSTICTSRSIPAQNPSFRPRWVSAQPPNRRSSDGVQGAGATLSRVKCTAVHQHNRLHEAFDRIKHSALWSSLQFYGIEPAYIRLLQRLFLSSRRDSLNR